MSHAVFFDVDNTLLRGCSISSFINFVAAELEDVDLAKNLKQLQGESKNYTSHEELMRDGFRLLAGRSWQKLIDLGESWFEERGKEAMIPETCLLLEQHLGNAECVVLLSGSWNPCLLPFANFIDVNEILCTRPLVVEEVFTGEVDYPLIGHNKLQAVVKFMETKRLDPSRCVTYGDHATDIDVLEYLGHPIVVGTDPTLCGIAEARGWKNIRPENTLSAS